MQGICPPGYSAHTPTYEEGSSSSSSSDPFRDFDIHHASPREKRKKFSQLAQKELDAQDPNWRINPRYQTNKIKERFYKVATYEYQQTTQLIIGYTGIFSGFFTTSLAINRATDSAWASIRKRYLQQPKTDLLNLTENLTTSKSWYENVPMPIALGILTGGMGVTYAAWKYESVAKNLKEKILWVFHQISDQFSKKPISAQQLLDNVQEIFREKEESWFGRMFARQNPLEMSVLFFTRAIAFDSLGSYANAQLDYETALRLNNNLDHNQKERTRFAYARSLRLSGQHSDTILAQLDRINAHSLFHKLAKIERLLLNNIDPTEEFDQNQAPHDFFCPITEDVMTNPIYHEFQGVRCYFELPAIRTWLNNHEACPCCLKVLKLNEWVMDLTLQQLIQFWKQTRLIQSSL
ncbi:MAG: U-box domain-containing protein [Chlamydiales bacterium]